MEGTNLPPEPRVGAAPAPSAAAPSPHGANIHVTDDTWQATDLYTGHPYAGLTVTLFSFAPGSPHGANILIIWF